MAEYVGRTFTKYGGDTRLAVENLAVAGVPLPPDVAADATDGEKLMWKLKCEHIAKREVAMDDNIKTLYSIVWGQCTDIMRQKLEGLDGFGAMSATGSGIDLLKAIKDIAFNFQSQKYLPHALHESKRRFYLCSQGRLATTQAYLEQFQNVVDVIEHSGGLLGFEPGVVRDIATEKGYDEDNLTEAQKDEVRIEGKNRYLAVAFILGSDRSRYGRLIEELENSYLMGENNYPVTVTGAYGLLTNWKQDPRNLMRGIGLDSVSFTNVDDGGADGKDVALANDGKPRGKGGGKKDKSDIKCFKCQKFGHYSNECKEETQDKDRETGATMLMDGIEKGEFDQKDHFQFTLSQQGEVGATLQTGTDGRVPKTWILLDNQSTVDVFYNDDLLENIRENDTYMDIHCNAGVTSTNMVGELPGYGTVWYHPKGIANILSLARIKERGYQVTYDSHNGNLFRMKKPDGTVRVFKQSERGLFYMETSGGAAGVTLINTVADNRSNYTNRDYSRAVLARQIQKMIGRPSTRTFISIVENNLLPNCPITKRDIEAAEHIFGRDVGSLMGKTVRRQGPRVEGFTVDIPAIIMNRYKNVILAGDIMFVNKIPFLMTVSRYIKFGTAVMIKNKSNKTILAQIKAIQKVYMRRGFVITTLLMDGGFESMRADLADLRITLNTVSNAEHVPDIERHIRTIKERTRCVYNMLPFQKMPHRLVIEMVYMCNFWLNTFPPGDGISDTLSPRAIVVGTQIDYARHCQIEFGTYVHTHEDHDNSMATRTTGAIALRPTGNEQGGYYFFSLGTGKVLNRNNWTVLPMPADVIERIHWFARQDEDGLGFADRDGNLDDGNDNYHEN